MDKPISTLIKKAVVTVDIDDSIETIEDVLQSNALSLVPVLDSREKVFGVITTSDILKLHATRKNPKLVRAWELCSHEVIEIGIQTPIKAVAELIVSHRIHHVLVADAQAIIGVVSSIDVIQSLLETVAKRADCAPRPNRCFEA